MWGREAGFSTAQLAKAQAASVEMTNLRVGEISKSNNQKQTQQAKTKQKQRQKQKCSACTVALRQGIFQLGYGFLVLRTTTVAMGSRGWAGSWMSRPSPALVSLRGLWVGSANR
jgi:hypothetical protein